MVAMAFGILDEELRDRAVMAKIRVVGHSPIDDDGAIQDMGIAQLRHKRPIVSLVLSIIETAVSWPMHIQEPERRRQRENDCQADRRMPKRNGLRQ